MKWQSAVKTAHAVLVDLDGCLLRGDQPAPGAAALVRSCANRLIVVSNNSTHTPEAMSALLDRIGLAVPAGRIVLAGTQAIDHVVATRPAARVLALAVDAIRDYGRQRGAHFVDDDADTVLVCRDLALSYARIAAAVRSLAAGATLVVANPDLTHPGGDGRPVPETGSLAAALRAAVPDAAIEVIGKPRPAMFREALRRCGAAPDQAVMIGDNPDTDGAGARNAGIAAIIVGPRAGADLPDLTALTA